MTSSVSHFDTTRASSMLESGARKISALCDALNLRSLEGEVLEAFDLLTDPWGGRVPAATQGAGDEWPGLLEAQQLQRLFAHRACFAAPVNLQVEIHLGERSRSLGETHRVPQAEGAVRARGQQQVGHCVVALSAQWVVLSQALSEHPCGVALAREGAVIRLGFNQHTQLRLCGAERH